MDYSMAFESSISNEDIIDNDNLFWNNFTNNDYWDLLPQSLSSQTPLLSSPTITAAASAIATTTASKISSSLNNFNENNNNNNNIVDTLWNDIYNCNDLIYNNNKNPQNEQMILKNRCKIPQYYSLFYQMIGTLFQGIIFIVGLIGNVMVIIVVLRSRSMRTPTNCYLVSLAVSDTMVLLASVPNEIISYYLLGDRWIWGSFGCALFIFLQYLGINASSLSIAAFTIERYIAICHPMLAHKLCTVRRAKRIIMYVWMFATTYCAPWLFLTKTERIHYLWINTEVYTCKFKLNREYYKGYYLTDIVLFYILPLLISCVLYALIARILYHSNDMINSTTKKTSTTSLSNAHSIQHQHHHNHHFFFHHHASPSTTTTTSSTLQQESSTIYSENQQQHHGMKITNLNSKKTSSHDSSRVQVVKMLAVVVAVFATLWLPYRALVVYNSFSFPPYMELWYLMFAKTMIFVNSAINPIIYSACSMKFRREFKRMLTCGRKKRETNIINYRYGGINNNNNNNINFKTKNKPITKSGNNNIRCGKLLDSSSMSFTIGPELSININNLSSSTNIVRRASQPPSFDFQKDYLINVKDDNNNDKKIRKTKSINEINDDNNDNNIFIKSDENSNESNIPTILVTNDNNKKQQQKIRLNALTVKTNITSVYNDHHQHDGKLYHTETTDLNNDKNDNDNNDENNNNNDCKIEFHEHQF